MNEIETITIIEHIKIWIVETLFKDQARLVELLSLFCLFGFFMEFYTHPEVLQRDSYVAFNFFDQTGWLMFTGAGVIGSLLSVLSNGTHSNSIRIINISCSCGFWLLVALSFVSSGISTTAVGTYSSLTLTTFLTGVYLSWKSNSPTL